MRLLGVFYSLLSDQAAHNLSICVEMVDSIEDYSGGRTFSLYIYNGPQRTHLTRKERNTPGPVLGDSGSRHLRTPSPVCHLRTPSPVRHLRTPSPVLGPIRATYRDNPCPPCGRGGVPPRIVCTRYSNFQVLRGCLLGSQYLYLCMTTYVRLPNMDGLKVASGTVHPIHYRPSCYQ